jgi:hypothetical protein
MIEVEVDCRGRRAFVRCRLVTRSFGSAACERGAKPNKCAGDFFDEETEGLPDRQPLLQTSSIKLSSRGTEIDH